MIKFTEGFEFRDVITILILIGTLVWTIAIQPQQVLSECTTRFASRERADMMQEDISYIKGKVDRLIEIVQYEGVK